MRRRQTDAPLCPLSVVVAADRQSAGTRNAWRRQLWVVDGNFVFVPQYHDFPVVVQTRGGCSARLFEGPDMFAEGGLRVLRSCDSTECRYCRREYPGMSLNRFSRRRPSCENSTALLAVSPGIVHLSTPGSVSKRWTGFSDGRGRSSFPRSRRIVSPPMSPADRSSCSTRVAPCQHTTTGDICPYRRSNPTMACVTSGTLHR